MKSFAMAPGTPVEVMAEAMGAKPAAKPAPATETPAPKRRPATKPES